MNLQQQEEFYQVMTRHKANSSSRSRAASLSTRDARVTEMVNGLLVSKPAKKIEEAKTTTRVWRLTPQGPVLESKAASVPGINKRDSRLYVC